MRGMMTQKLACRLLRLTCCLVVWHAMVWYLTMPNVDYDTVLYETKSFLPNFTSDTYKVPNIIHYIWYTEEPIEFRFDKALSVMSAMKYIQPDAVYFHTNMPPTGMYFERLTALPKFKVIHREPPRDVLRTTYHETDYSDYDKVKIVMEHGGIYLDLDVMVVKSFNSLRKYSCTMGYESGRKLCSGVIICSKDHPFLYLWLNSYFEDFRRKWAYNSGQVSTRLAKRYSYLVHLEETSLHRPSYFELEQIWGAKTFDWSKNYAIHTWIRKAGHYFHKFPTPESIKIMNSTYGKLARLVYYGSTDLIMS